MTRDSWMRCSNALDIGTGWILRYYPALRFPWLSAISGCCEPGSGSMTTGTGSVVISRIEHLQGQLGSESHESISDENHHGEDFAGDSFSSGAPEGGDEG